MLNYCYEDHDYPTRHARSHEVKRTIIEHDQGQGDQGTERFDKAGDSYGALFTLGAQTIIGLLGLKRFRRTPKVRGLRLGRVD